MRYCRQPRNIVAPNHNYVVRGAGRVVQVGVNDDLYARDLGARTTRLR